MQEYLRIRLANHIIFLTVLIACLVQGCADKTGHLVESSSNGTPISSSPSLEPANVPSEVINSSVEVSKLLAYGEGVPGAIDFEEMKGVGNCGHFAVLLARRLSHFDPRGVSLMAANGANHRVVEIEVDKRRVIVDATLGIVIPYSIKEIFRNPAVAWSYIGQFDSKFSPYGPELYTNGFQYSTDSSGYSDISLDAEIEAPITNQSLSSDESASVLMTIAKLHWPQIVRIHSIRIFVNNREKQSLRVLVQSGASGESLSSFEFTPRIRDGFANIVFPEPQRASEVEINLLGGEMPPIQKVGVYGGI